MSTQLGPLETIDRLGFASASALDLLAIALSDAETEVDYHLSPAKEILEKYRMQRLVELSRADLKEFVEIEGFAATRILAAFHLGRKAGLAAKGDPLRVDKASDAAYHFAYLKDEKKEHFCAMFLDAKNQILGVRTIHIGTVNMSVVGPREVFREAIREGAASIIVAHNHPSGDPTPSEEDINITLKLATVGEMIDVLLLDHVIIGHHRFVSLKEMGAI